MVPGECVCEAELVPGLLDLKQIVSDPASD